LLRYRRHKTSACLGKLNWLYLGSGMATLVTTLAAMHLRRVRVVGLRFAAALAPAHAAQNQNDMRRKRALRCVQHHRINDRTRAACSCTRAASAHQRPNASTTERSVAYACSINASTTERINHRTADVHQPPYEGCINRFLVQTTKTTDGRIKGLMRVHTRASKNKYTRGSWAQYNDVGRGKNVEVRGV
jgi:hypothetical protein